MATIWIIAPGNRAEDWSVFAQLGCIGIGWLEERERLNVARRRLEVVHGTIVALARRHRI